MKGAKLVRNFNSTVAKLLSLTLNLKQLLEALSLLC